MMKKTAAMSLILALLLSSCTAGGDGETTESLTEAYPEIDFQIDEESEATQVEGNALEIDLSDESSTDGMSGVSFADGELKITKGGVYTLSGKLSDGRITVSAGDKDDVELILSNAEISSSYGPAMYFSSADKVYLTLPAESESTVSDGDSYTLELDGSNIDGAVFSKADLTIRGEGKLTVKGNNKHGIVSKDDLVITGGVIDIESTNVAVNGKDCVKIAGAELTLVGGSDGIRSDNAEDATRGYVYVESGKIDITSGNDGIQAETAVSITGGDISIVSGGGSENASTTDDGQWNDGWGHWGGPMGGGMGDMNSTDSIDDLTESAKGIKATTTLSITGGTVTVDSSDDSLHSNGDITINGGVIFASSGDDGIHADGTFSLADGEVKVLKSYEGFEASVINISGGDASIVASDDGLNAAGGNDSSALGGRPGQGSFESSTGEITLSGGYLRINASGDGIDSNGSVNVTGGVTLVSGPTDSGNGAFDYATEAKVSGGILVATGAVGMATGFTSAENQCAMLVTTGTQDGGVPLTVCDSEGNVVVSCVPATAYQCAVITSPGIVEGGKYSLTVGGEADACDEYGFASDGGITGAESVLEVEMTDSIYNAVGGMGGMDPGMGGMDPGMGGMDPGMGGMMPGMGGMGGRR